jgi:hypothetical protein
MTFYQRQGMLPPRRYTVLETPHCPESVLESGGKEPSRWKDRTVKPDLTARARAGRLRRARVDPHLALPDRHQPLPQRPTGQQPESDDGRPSAVAAPPEPTRLGDVPWLEPYPDLLLDQLPGTA